MVLGQAEEPQKHCLLRENFEKNTETGEKIVNTFFDIEKVMVVEWTMWKKDLPEVIGRTVMCLHRETKTKVRVGSELFK